MARSSERCEQAGVYESICDDGTRIALLVGARFPACRKHGVVEWSLLESRPRRPAQTQDQIGTGAEPEWRTGSGERCRNTGVYESECAERIKIAVMKGSRFPTCGNHGDVDWVLVKARRS